MGKRYNFVESKSKYSDEFGILTRYYYDIMFDSNKVGVLEIDVRRNDNYVWLYRIYVYKKSRNKGAGTAAINFCIKFSRSLEKKSIRCHIRSLDDNETTELCKWYARRGFQISEENRKFYGTLLVPEAGIEPA